MGRCRVSVTFRPRDSLELVVFSRKRRLDETYTDPVFTFRHQPRAGRCGRRHPAGRRPRAAVPRAAARVGLSRRASRGAAHGGAGSRLSDTGCAACGRRARRLSHRGARVLRPPLQGLAGGADSASGDGRAGRARAGAHPGGSAERRARSGHRAVAASRSASRSRGRRRGSTDSIARPKRLRWRAKMPRGSARRTSAFP